MPIKHLSCNDILTKYNNVKITQCYKCVNWINDRNTKRYINSKQSDGSKRYHQCSKNEIILNDDGLVLSINGFDINQGQCHEVNQLSTNNLPTNKKVETNISPHIDDMSNERKVILRGMVYPLNRI